MGLIDQMMANLYKPPKQEKPNTVLPKNLTPAKVANLLNQTTVSQGQLLKGQVLDLRANQIQVLLENGITVSARTEGTLELSIGQHAKFFVAQTTEEQILLKLAKEDTPTENPMIDKALSVANIQKTERSVSIVTELLNHQQPVNEAGIRHYLSLSAKYPELPVKDLILMELHHIPVTKENVEQFTTYQDRNAKLLTQAQDMLSNLTETISHLPENSEKQEILKELQNLLLAAKPVETNAGSASVFPKTEFSEPVLAETLTKETATLPDAETNIVIPDNEFKIKPSVQIPVSDAELPKDVQENNTLSAKSETSNNQTPMPEVSPAVNEAPVTPVSANSVSSAIESSLAKHPARPDREPLIKDFLRSFLLKPEDIAEPEKIQKYYEELNEKLSKLEQLSQRIAEQTSEDTANTAPKQMRQNLSFMEAVNNVFPYLQLPLKFKETPAHGELYVYEKKKALKPSDTLSALLHLELEALGTTDIFVTLAGNHVTTRFSMTDKESGDLIRTELPKLTEALAQKGYTLQSEVTIREPEEENAPTLLEQFLEEHAPGGLNRYTFDIRA